jgi:hypothetical protein
MDEAEHGMRDPECPRPGIYICYTGKGDISSLTPLLLVGSHFLLEVTPLIDSWNNLLTALLLNG